MRRARQNLVVQFSVISFVIVAIVAVVSVLVISSQIRVAAVNDLAEHTKGDVALHLLKTITPADLEEPMTGERYDRFHEFVQQFIVSGQTARVKLWATDGTVLYSDNREEVGQKFPDDESLIRALQGETVTEIKKPGAPENERERSLGTLMEVYTPIVFPGYAEPQGAFEVYQYYGPTAQLIQRLQRSLVLVGGVGLIFLYSASVIIVWRGWRTIQRQQADLGRAYEALRESEELHRTVVENVAEAVAITRDAKRIFVNKAFLDIHGLQNASQVIGKPMGQFISPGDREMAVGRSLARQRGEPVPSTYEYRVLRPDGEVRTVRTLAVPLKYKGQPATLAVLRDVTDERRAEEERVQYAWELEETLQHLQETQQQLIQSEKLAAIGQLVSGVAHELNNPLTGVWGTCQLIMRRDMDETLREDIEVIHNEAARAVKIVQNLLAFARPHRPERNYGSINDVLEKALELRAYEMRVSGIELETDLQHDLPETLFDFNQMQQVFLNIVVNAEQAMAEAHGGGKLLVRTQRVGGSIRISFTDDGPGIPKENLGRIFDPFFTTKGVGKGTGLGLSICYGIVQEHGGRLRVESEVGKGATFTVEIPITTEEMKG